MKRVLMLVVGLLLAIAGYAVAQEDVVATESEAVVTTEPAVVQLSASEMKDVLATKKAALNNTEWTIELKPMAGGSKVKAEKDTITFSDGKVSSANLAKAGFSATNFSTRLLDDETLTWETMQTSEKSGIIFWRGDLGTDGVMRGVMSKRDLKNVTTDFNFLSSGSPVTVAPIVEEKVTVTE